MVKNGSVDLYYDSSKKFETTSTGVQVTGQVIAKQTQEPQLIIQEPSACLLILISIEVFLKC